MTLGLSLSIGNVPLRPSATLAPTLLRVLNNADFGLTAELESSHNDDVNVGLTLDGLSMGVLAVSRADWETASHKLVDPIISGTPAVGETLVSTRGLWLINPDPSYEYSYQWLAGGIPIVGATQDTFTITSDQTGMQISLQEIVADKTATSNVLEVPAASLSWNTSLLDNPPTVVSRCNVSSIASGVRVTHLDGGDARMSWSTTDALDDGVSYRLRGVVTYRSSDGLPITELDFVGTPNYRINGTTGLSDSVQISGNLLPGLGDPSTFNLDVTFVASGAEVRELTIRVGRASAAGAIMDLENFLLESV